MDRPEIERYIAESKGQAVDTINSHVQKLYDLESLFGFDLDVATDIYGTHLLDATDAYTSAVVQKWHELLTLLRDQPGQPLWVVQTYKKLVEQCYGFGAPEEYTDHTYLTYIAGANLDSVHYIRGNEDNPAPSIVLSDVTAIQLDASWQRRPDEAYEAEHILVLAQGQTYGNGVRSFDSSPVSTGILTFNPDTTLILPIETNAEPVKRIVDVDWSAISAMQRVEDQLR